MSTSGSFIKAAIKLCAWRVASAEPLKQRIKMSVPVRLWKWKLVWNDNDHYLVDMHMCVCEYTTGYIISSAYKTAVVLLTWYTMF